MCDKTNSPPKIGYRIENKKEFYHRKKDKIQVESRNPYAFMNDKEENSMSVTILDQLEDKIKQAVETIQLLQLEVDELKGKNDEANRANEALRQEHEQLKAEHQDFQDRLRSLLGQINNV